MPIYEYECSDCGHRLEALRKMNDDPLTGCPSCGKDTLRKRVSKVAFRLKGTGWYETDFKDKPAKAKTEESDKSGKDASGDPKDTGGKEDKTTATTGGPKKLATKADE